MKNMGNSIRFESNSVVVSLDEALINMGIDQRLSHKVTLDKVYMDVSGERVYVNAKAGGLNLFNS